MHFQGGEGGGGGGNFVKANLVLTNAFLANSILLEHFPEGSGRAGKQIGTRLFKYIENFTTEKLKVFK